MKKKRIFYLTFDGLQDNLGQSQILPYLKELSKNAYEFYVYSFEKHPPSVLFQSKIQQLKIHWFYGKYRKNKFFLDKILQVLLTTVIIGYLLIKHKIQILHARGYPAAVIACVFKVLSQKKYIFDMRGFFPEERVDGDVWRKEGLTYRFVKYIEKYLLIFSDVIIVLTHKAKNILQTSKMYPKLDVDKIYAIPTCVDIDFFQSFKMNGTRLKGEIKLVYLGSLGTWYMLDEMLYFYFCFLKRYPNAHLTFITPELEERIIPHLSKYHLTPAQISVFSAHRDQIPGLLKQADFSLFFIRPAYSKQASCATKFAESLACGVPVIVNQGIGDQDALLKNHHIGISVPNFSKKDYQDC